MRKALLPLLLLACLGLSAPALARDAGIPDPARATTQLFAVGGTPLSNGVFFPGTVICNLGTCTGTEAPLQVPKGNDIQFVNLDSAAVANTHQIICYKRNKRTGRPVCQSANVAGPGEDTMVTSHLKAGLYEFVCSTHNGMRGAFEIVDQ